MSVPVKYLSPAEGDSFVSEGCLGVWGLGDPLSGSVMGRGGGRQRLEPGNSGSGVSLCWKEKGKEARADRLERGKEPRGWVDWKPPLTLSSAQEARLPPRQGC